MQFLPAVVAAAQASTAIRTSCVLLQHVPAALSHVLVIQF